MISIVLAILIRPKNHRVLYCTGQITIENIMIILQKFVVMTSILTGLTSLLLIWLAVQRSNLNYNSEGNYFDESTSTVYHEHSVISYSVLAIVAVLVTILLTLGVSKFSRR